MICDRVNGRVYVGQTTSPQRRLREHTRFPPLKMRADVKLYVPFKEHFQMDIVYRTTQKYLADRMEKKLIKKLPIGASKKLQYYKGPPVGRPFELDAEEEIHKQIMKTSSHFYLFIYFIVGGAYYVRHTYK